MKTSDYKEKMDSWLPCALEVKLLYGKMNINEEVDNRVKIYNDLFKVHYNSI